MEPHWQHFLRTLPTTVIMILAVCFVLLFTLKPYEKRLRVIWAICISASLLFFDFKSAFQLETAFLPGLTRTIVGALGWILLFVPFAFYKADDNLPRWLRGREWLLFPLTAVGFLILRVVQERSVGFAGTEFIIAAVYGCVLLLLIAYVLKLPRSEKRSSVMVAAMLYLAIGATVFLFAARNTYAGVLPYVVLVEIGLAAIVLYRVRHGGWWRTL